MAPCLSVPGSGAWDLYQERAKSGAGEEHVRTAADGHRTAAPQLHLTNNTANTHQDIPASYPLNYYVLCNIYSPDKIKEHL